jgi:myo-inositol-hexaphosphate 3-phosphohydrolase
VFDDENKTVFISEEEVNGVLKAYNLNNEFPFEIPFIVDSREGNIGGDPEGLTIYKTSEKEGYILLSSKEIINTTFIIECILTNLSQVLLLTMTQKALMAHQKPMALTLQTSI